MVDFSIEYQVSGPLKTNTYLLWDKASREAAFFDIGGKVDNLIRIAKKEELYIRYIFCTHGHFDHIMGIPDVRKIFPDAQVCINEKELEVIKHHSFFARMFGFNPKKFGQPDILIEDGMKFQLGDLELEAILTPGHTPGSICFYFDKSLFSGDLLFYRSVGRTDLYGGDFEALVKSIKKIYTLPDDTIVYPGHMQSTLIGEEKRENPVVRI